MDSSEKFLIAGAALAVGYALYQYNQALNAAGNLGQKIADSQTMQDFTDWLSGMGTLKANLNAKPTTAQMQVFAAFRDAQAAAAANGTVAPLSFYVPDPGVTVLHPETWIIWPADSGLNTASIPL